MAKNSRKKRSNGKNSKMQRCGAYAFGLLSYAAKFLWRCLTSATAFKCYIVGVVLFAVYVIYLDATIRDTFDGKKWQLPARVYARPLELFVGLQLKPEELEAELKDLGYHRGNFSSAGSYFRRANVVGVFSRGYQFWDGAEKPVQVKVKFHRGQIQQLQNLAGKNVPLLRLEPLSIGAIYPQHREDRLLVQHSDVPPLLLAALVAIEDHRFYQHQGISPKSIARAAFANVKQRGVVQGGSTITQQLVKNYYLSQERTVRRKLTEAIMSVLLELHYEKEAILEAYLNEVYLGQAGARAIHGFGLASQHYFNRNIGELSVEKLALLVALVRGPTFYDPWRYPERAMKRRNHVIDTLVREELLANHDATWAKTQPLNLGKKTRSHYVFPAYMDLVKRQLTAHYSTGDLTSNGLNIYTSFNPRVQRAAENAIVTQLAQKGDDNLQAAVVVTHPATGEVLAVVGGRLPRYAGFNRALDAKRSIGSTVKPFVYLAALQQSDKYTLATMVSDGPVEIEIQRDSAIETWSPRNFDRKSHGEVALINALAHSYNQATARIGNDIGITSVADMLVRAGAPTPINAVPSMFIGTTQLSALNVAQLYQTLAANGYRTPLKAIRSVLNADNKPLKHFPFELKQVIDDKMMHLIQHALIHVGEDGSARRARASLPTGFTFAGKTGTSGGQRDSWFAGYTGDLLAVVWVGRDDNSPTKYTGSSAALPIWTDIISAVSKVPLYVSRRKDIDYAFVDLQSGGLSRKSCKSAKELPFIKGTAPSTRTVCTALR